MLGRVVFLLLPVVMGAMECSEGGCVNSRISGGDVTQQNSRPFQVALYMRVGTTGELGFCGGALVHAQWVLSAAHCCFHDGAQVDHVQGILGAHSLYDRYENGRRIVSVDLVHAHPQFSAGSFAHDIALLRLASVVQLTDTVNVVRLPYLSISSFNFAGMAATASGWGIAAPSVTFVAPTLREKLMTVMTDPLCQSAYFNLLPENTVCGFNLTAGTCKGDNGGPMTIFYNATQETILIGVASFVDASGCNENVPSVFTRVQRYLDWISEVTGIILD